MGNLALQPLEIKDFSGGMTDYFLQGGPTRYEKADNFLINTDRKLEVRYGSAPLDSVNYQIPGPPRRIDSFILYNREQELFAQVGRDIFYLNPNWTRLTGPTGNEAIGAGGSYNQVSSAEWNTHLFFTSDAGPLPGKVYRDSNGALQVRTAGLPVPVGIPTYTDGSLLTACIALANDLRASMVAHINDTKLHQSPDKWSLSYFTTQTWFIFDLEYPGPQPAPTPAPAATNQASLFNLILALCLAYEHHGADPEDSLYHLNITYDNGGGGGSIPPKGPFRKLSNNTKPSDMKTAAAQLDELYTRWNWHRLGIWTHSATNDYSAINKYALTQSKIGSLNLEGIPVVTPDYSDSLRYVNYLKAAYNRHVTNDVNLFGTYYHSQQINSLFDDSVSLPDCTDLDSMFLLIYWIRMNYGGTHVFDSNWPFHTNTTMNTTAGSANVTNVGGGSLVLQVGNWVIATSDIYQGTANNLRAARVVSSGAGTATLSKPLAATVTGQAVQYSNSFYHGSFQFGSLNTSTNLRASTDEFLDPQPTSGLLNNSGFPSSTKEWIDWAAEVFNALALHMGNSSTHMQSNAIENFLQGSGPFFKPTISSYGYAFLYKYSYTTNNGVEFLNQSAPVFIGPIETGTSYPIGTVLDVGSTNFFPFQNSVAQTAVAKISNLPSITNTKNTNYDTANIQVRIFRTTDTGSTYYSLGDVANGTATFNDTVNDTLANPGSTQLNTRELIYTTGGVVQNDPPPTARYLHILNNTAYYGDITDTGQRFQNRIIQSIPGSPDAVSLTFSDDLEDSLSGISSTRNNLVAFGRTTVYRLSGGFNNLGQGSITHERISDSIGCVSSRSIVKTEIGIFFAGNDGFYYTDGFQLIKISIDLDETYAKHTRSDAQKNRISGTYDRFTRRVWWTLQSEATDTDCNVCFIFYLDYGVKPSGVFTTASNGTHFRPSSLTFYKTKLIRGDERGLVFIHDSVYKTDPKVPANVSTPLSQWGTVYIPYDYRSSALDFGTIYRGQWVTKAHLVAKNSGNAAILLSTIRENDHLNRRTFAPIRFSPNPMWGDARVVWGDSTYVWKYDGKLDEKRRFPNGSLRSQLRQIQITPAKVGVYRSDDFPDGATANVNASAKTATIATPSGYSSIVWPLDVVDMTISFSTDGYVNEFPVTAVATNVITFSDSGSLSVNDTAAKWVIRGVMKEQRLSLLSYALNFAQMGERGEVYYGKASRGENKS